MLIALYYHTYTDPIEADAGMSAKYHPALLT